MTQHSEESLLKEVVRTYKHFSVAKKLADGHSTLYKIDYFGSKLNVVESMEEGQTVLAGRVSINRYYIEANARGQGAEAIS